MKITRSQVANLIFDERFDLVYLEAAGFILAILVSVDGDFQSNISVFTDALLAVFPNTTGNKERF